MAIAAAAPLGPDGSTVGEGDVTVQTRRCFDVALEALAVVGGTAADVARTPMMLTDIRRWRQAAAVHGEYFAAVRPACTFVQMTGCIDPAWLVDHG